MDFTELQALHRKNESKILLLVMDGLGGLPRQPEGRTELEHAHTPHMDKLAAESICGLHVPVAPGITPGSGPAHLGLFGYDPLKYKVGRGILSALGVDFDLQKGDVAARGNFCTVDEEGVVTDRRAGRISTEKSEELCELLSSIEVEGARIYVQPVKEYRFLLVIRGDGLSGEIHDTDPQETGQKPLKPKAKTKSAEKTASIVADFLAKAGEKLSGHYPANMLLTRGFSTRPDWPDFEEAFGLRAAAVAAYPMYRGVSRLVGMHALQTEDSLEEEFKTVKDSWDDFDFFYVHVKKIDSYGEDGAFDKKVKLIEEVDTRLPDLLSLNPDVVIITGDHSTPAVMKKHGFQPVPLLLWSRICRTDSVTAFGERDCMSGGLGPRLPAVDIMPLALANAQRLDKFGA